MIAFWITAALVATQPNAVDRIAEARHAIEVGRIDQAKAMTAEAVTLGASGDTVDRLLADLAFVSDNPDLALARFEALMLKAPNEAALAERAGLAALRLRQTDKAATYLRRATTLRGATWRSWNGLAVAADRQGDFSTADRAYATARDMAPESAEVANNQGWSLLLRGRWQDAVAPLERAATLDPSSTRIADNLDLARSAQSVSLPERRRGERASDWAARLNDAGIVAGMQGNRKRAIAAFAQAIEARTEWFARAANNLAALEIAR